MDEYTDGYGTLQRPLNPGEARQPSLNGAGTNMDTPNPWYQSLGQNLYNDFGNPLGILSLLSTGLGIGSNIYAGRQQDQNYSRLLQQARTPVNPQQYIPQITEAERAAMERAMKGDMALRGVPLDSMVASGAISELMGRDALQRWQMGMGAAQNQQNSLLAALGQAPRQQPMGDMSALGNYLGMLSQQRTRQASERQNAGQQTEFMNFLKNIYGAQGAPQGPYGGGGGGSNQSTASSFTPVDQSLYGDF